MIIFNNALHCHSTSVDIKSQIVTHVRQTQKDSNRSFRSIGILPEDHQAT